MYTVPISHGEGRFLASEALVTKLAEQRPDRHAVCGSGGQAHHGRCASIPTAPCCAIEGITSPDGRVFGKMGHSERIGKDLYRNVPGEYDIRMFEAAVKYFK